MHWLHNYDGKYYCHTIVNNYQFNIFFKNNKILNKN